MGCLIGAAAEGFSAIKKMDPKKTAERKGDAAVEQKKSLTKKMERENSLIGGARLCSLPREAVARSRKGGGKRV